MIRTIVLIGLLAVMFYCAFGSAQADEFAAAATSVRLAAPQARVQRQFLPGSMAALHLPLRDLAVSLRSSANVRLKNADDERVTTGLLTSCTS